MNYCKSKVEIGIDFEVISSKVGIGIDIEVISSTELQSQKSEGCFHFLSTPSAYDSVDYLLLESQESVEINHNATTTTTTPTTLGV